MCRTFSCMAETIAIHVKGQSFTKINWILSLVCKKDECGCLEAIKICVHVTCIYISSNDIHLVVAFMCLYTIH